MTSEALPCCCGGVTCCPFSSVVWTGNATSFRFVDTVNGTPTIGRYRTVNSSGQPAVIQLSAAVTAAQVLTRRVSTGADVPFCIYNRFGTNFGTPTGWTTTSPFSGGFIQKRIDTTGFAALDFVNSTRYQLAWFAETYPVSGTATPPGWEAGLYISIEFGGTVPTTGLVIVGARASINANGCPNALQYISFNSGTSHLGRGTIRGGVVGGFTGAVNSRLGSAEVGQTAVFADTQFAPTIT
jgi:hypothetical protein